MKFAYFLIFPAIIGLASSLPAAPILEDRADPFDFSAASDSRDGFGIQSFLRGDFAERVLSGYQNFNFLRLNHRALVHNYIAAEPAEANTNENGGTTTAPTYSTFDSNLFAAVGGFSDGSRPKSVAVTSSAAPDITAGIATWVGSVGNNGSQPGTPASPLSGGWSTLGNWTPDRPASSDSITLRFGGSTAESCTSTNDTNVQPFTFSSIILNSSSSATNVIDGTELALSTNGGSSINQTGSGAFVIANLIEGPNLPAGTSGTAQLHLTGDGLGQITLSGTLSDLGASKLALLKDGASTFVVTSTNNTYSGGTTISGGTLLANNALGNGQGAAGSATGSGPVAVNNGGTLGGNGNITVTNNVLNGVTVAAPITVTDGTVSPGDQAGTIGALTLTATRVIFGDASTLLVDLSSISNLSDLLRISGGILDLSSLTNMLQFTGPASSAPLTTYTLATYQSVIGTFDMTNLPTGYTLVYGPTSLLMTNDPTAVPEPSTCVAGCFT
ncbi:MAG: autotransporter-associated beta strand repeat-containing protein, partial [Verrucomicrobiota bacterium]|nr:autotransporter-associated beta strand repeat-containing protein [Verrucomicrobiota bacterium]